VANTAVNLQDTTVGIRNDIDVAIDAFNGGMNGLAIDYGVYITGHSSLAVARSTVGF
jgi:hypothetical protein